MTTFRLSFTAEVWEHDGPGSWHFVDLPTEAADDIKEIFGGRVAGFGSVRVEVTIGHTRWLTSVFSDSKRGTYVLPLKKAVRAAEHLASGSTAEIDLVVLA